MLDKSLHLPHPLLKLPIDRLAQVLPNRIVEG